MRLIAVIALLITALLGFEPARAQNTDCDPASVIAKLAPLKTTGDQSKDMQTLDIVESMIANVRASCAGLAFKGTKSSQVVGPIDLPSGNFKVVATTIGNLRATIKVLDGDCEVDGIFVLFYITKGEGKDGAESTMTSKGCRLTINTSNVSAPWTIVFEQLQ